MGRIIFFKMLNLQTEAITTHFVSEKNVREKGFELSSEGTQDLEQIYGTLVMMADLTLSAIEKWDKEAAEKASQCEDEIDKMEELFHGRHIHRLNTGMCSVLSAEHFVEVLVNIERMGDHLENICESIIIEKVTEYDEKNH